MLRRALLLWLMAAGACAPRDPHGADRLRSEVLELLRHHRTTEGRLAGGFLHAACNRAEQTDDVIPRTHCSPLPRPGSEEFEKLGDLTSDLRERLRQAPDAPRLLYTAALLELVWHQNDTVSVDRAVAWLETIAEGPPDSTDARDPDLLNDLAAAHLLRAEVRQDPEEIMLALDKADQAIELEPDHVEALFNRALALDRLYLSAQAADAWRRFLEVDDSSDWADEARSRLEGWVSLPTDGGSRTWQRAVMAAARDRDGTVLDSLVTDAPGAARALVMDRLLGEWALSRLEGDSETAADALWTSRAIGERLARTTGERTVDEAISVIDDGPAGSLRRSDVARAHLAWHRGRRLYSAEGDLAGAETHMRLAEPELRALGSSLADWAAYTRGAVALLNGRYAAADSIFNRTLARTDPSRHPALAGQLNWGSAVGNLRRGRYQQADEAYGRAARLFAAAREEEFQGALHYLRAENLHRMGRITEAMTSFYLGLEGLHRFPSSVWLNNALSSLGRLSTERGHWAAAVELHSEGLEVARRVDSPVNLPEAFVGRSRVYARMGETDRAQADLAAARRELARVQDPTFRSRVDADLRFAEAMVARHQDPASAIPALREALGYFQDMEMAVFLPEIRSGLAEILLQQGDTAGAIDELERAIELVENQRSRMSDLDFATAFGEAADGLFDRMMELNLVQGRHAEAFAWAERARALVLRTAVPARLESLTTPPGTALVQYEILSSSALAWILDGGVLRLVRLSVAPAQLGRQTRRLARLMEGRAPLRDLEAAATDLHEALLAPVRSELGPISRLVVVPDRFLHRVPFAALRDAGSGRYLIEDLELELATSAAHYLSSPRSAALQTKPTPPIQAPDGGAAQGEVLVVGDPAFDEDAFPGLSRLRGAAREVGSVGELYPGATRLIGDGATASRLMTEIADSEVLHYAGHALFNPSHPSMSMLVLAPPGAGASGVVTAEELRRLDLSGLRLAVLSACRSVSPGESRTGGLLGLARSFLSAGARGVVGSLWDVEDRGTASLMTAFHERYRAHGNAARALREAQVESLRGPSREAASPAAWGAFIFTGA